MFNYFEARINEAKKEIKSKKTLTSLLELVDTVVIVRATATSVTLSVTGFRLVVVPVSAEVAYVISLGNKQIYKIILKNRNQYKK